MTTVIVNNKYIVGSVVCAKTDLTTKLIVRRYVDRIYYCMFEGDPTRKEKVYFERELTRSF